jgi:hypothetical protein
MGIELREYDNLVIKMEPGDLDQKLPNLSGHRLLRVDGQLMMTQAIGPSPADVDSQSVVLATDANPFGIAPLEWSNALAQILHKSQGRKVKCDFTKDPVWLKQARWTGETGSYITVKIMVRPFFERDSAVISPALAQPGELTQGLCSPWQNDYRECSCYYWASARPDYVNVEPTPSGASRGDNWMQKARTGNYVADDYVDTRLLHYDELFASWESVLKFQVGGHDVPEPPAENSAVPLAGVTPVPSAPPPAKKKKSARNLSTPKSDKAPKRKR